MVIVASEEERRRRRTESCRRYRHTRRKQIRAWELARKRKWRAANPEKVAANTKRYREANREKCNAASSRWMKANREKVAEYQRQYYKRHPEKKLRAARARREQILAAFVCPSCVATLRTPTKH